MVVSLVENGVTCKACTLETHICFWPRINVTRLSSRWDLIGGCSLTHFQLEWKWNSLISGKLVYHPKKWRIIPNQQTGHFWKMPGCFDCREKAIAAAAGLWTFWWLAPTTGELSGEISWEILSDYQFYTDSMVCDMEFRIFGQCFGSYSSIVQNIFKILTSSVWSWFNTSCIFDISVLYKVNHEAFDTPSIIDYNLSMILKAILGKHQRQEGCWQCWHTPRWEYICVNNWAPLLHLCITL